MSVVLYRAAVFGLLRSSSVAAAKPYFLHTVTYSVRDATVEFLFSYVPKREE